MAHRFKQLQDWLGEQLRPEPFTLEALANDASFRRYYRVSTQACSYIACDMPPDKEKPAAFNTVTQILLNAQVGAPTIHAADVKAGLFLLEDFGDTTYLKALSDSNVDSLRADSLRADSRYAGSPRANSPRADSLRADSLYRRAIDELLKIQTIKADGLPLYDRALLLEEMQLFSDWYWHIHRAKKLTASAAKILHRSYA